MKVEDAIHNVLLEIAKFLKRANSILVPNLFPKHEMDLQTLIKKYKILFLRVDKSSRENKFLA